MLKRLLLPLVLACALAPAAQAAGGRYVFDGGTRAERGQVSSALQASSFDWSLVPGRIVIHIGDGVSSHATAGQIWLDARLLGTGRFSWGVVQHEYAHQVDFFLLDDAKRAELQAAIGGSAWCYSTAVLAHGAYGCERFASTLAWAYWPSSSNSMRPESATDESAAMAPASFRALLGRLIGAPTRLLQQRRSK
jgi:hypothetical protein